MVRVKGHEWSQQSSGTERFLGGFIPSCMFYTGLLILDIRLSYSVHYVSCLLGVDGVAGHVITSLLSSKDHQLFPLMLKSRGVLVSVSHRDIDQGPDCLSEAEPHVRDYAQIHQSAVTSHHIAAVCDSDLQNVPHVPEQASGLCTM